MTDSRLLLDQNIEPEVRHRLENYGHTAEHVLTHDTRLSLTVRQSRFRGHRGLS